MSLNGDSEDKPRRQPTLPDEYRRQHNSLDRLLAAFLLENPGKFPSTTTVMELAEWSHARMQNAELRRL
jgi:hypothetical protein